MHGQGSYVFKKTNDIYSGSWSNDKRHGDGQYQFGADGSIFVGRWENGQLNNGVWELKGTGKYTGSFTLGRPVGEGRFEFNTGINQDGEYVIVKNPDDEEPAEGEPPKAPNVAWKGRSIVNF
jgi:1-phosphatidylinositol-4-phosphate 5-kinase